MTRIWKTICNIDGLPWTHRSVRLILGRPSPASKPSVISWT